MNPLRTSLRRGVFKLTAALAMLLLVGSIHADDKNPGRILGGKPAISGGGSSRYYDGGGRFIGRSSASGSTTRMYDGGGRFTGRVDASKDSTRVYDRGGSFAGRSTRSGSDTRFYDSGGRFDGRSTTSGNTTRFYDSSGAFRGRAETSGGTTRYYDGAGKAVGRQDEVDLEDVMPVLVIPPFCPKDGMGVISDSCNSPLLVTRISRCSTRHVWTSGMGLWQEHKNHLVNSDESSKTADTPVGFPSA